MAAPGFTVVYAFLYRGDLEEYSQQYHLDTGIGTRADFIAIADAFSDTVDAYMPPNILVHRYYGYDDTDDDATYVYDVESDGITGGLAITDGILCPGDDAVWVRWNTERLSSRGKTIYLRKYFHPAFALTGDGTHNQASEDQTDALKLFADHATATGWNGAHLAGPDGLVPGGGSLASTFVTTRTLKRRGRRPTPP